MITGIVLLVLTVLTSCAGRIDQALIDEAEAVYCECMESYGFEVQSIRFKNMSAEVDLAPHNKPFDEVIDATERCEALAMQILGREEPLAIDHDFGEDLQTDIDVLTTGQEGGIIALLVRDGEVYTAVSGAADDHSKPMSIHTRFNIASVSKLYTAVIVYSLEQMGELKTDDPVVKYLPELDISSEITLNMLLGHTGGIPDYANNLNYINAALKNTQRVFTRKELLEFAFSETAGETNAGFSYSNTGFLLLGEIIERVSGEDLASGLERHITSKLSLSKTEYILPQTYPEDLAAGWLDPVSFGLAPDEDLPLMPVPSAFSGMQADGGIITTAGELRDFVEALFAGQLIASEYIEKMTVPGPDNAYYGRGLELFNPRDPEKILYGHAGGGSGYSAVLAYNPRNSDITIFFTNNDAINLQPLYRAYGLLE